MNQIKANPISQSTFKDNDEENIVHQEKSKSKYNENDLKPEMVSCENCKDVSSIIAVLPHLKSIDENKDLDVEEIGANYSFIIRCNNDDNIHKSIKYGVWASTEQNNERLSERWKQAQQQKRSIFLFFSVVKSGQFVGVAKMASDIKDESFAYWWPKKQWKNHFKVEWIFVKDIIYKYFSNLYNLNNDPVIRSRDGTEIDWEKTGKPMLKIFKEAPSDISIFNDFPYMDQRETELRLRKNTQYDYYGNQYYNYNYNQQYYGFQKQQFNTYYGNYSQNYNNMIYMPMVPNNYMMNQIYSMNPQKQFVNPNIYPPNTSKPQTTFGQQPANQPSTTQNQNNESQPEQQ